MGVGRWEQKKKRKERPNHSRLDDHDRRAGNSAPTPCVDREPPSLDMRWELSMTKHPSLAAVPLSMLQDSYGAPLFKVALRCFISTTNDPNQSRQQLEHSLWRTRLPFTQLPIWHIIKFTRFDPLTGTRSTADSIHVQPARLDRRQRPIPGRFDTALINDGTGTEYGIKGESECYYSSAIHSYSQ